MFPIAEQEFQQLLANWNSPDKNHHPVVKLFVPGAWCSWLLTEVNPNNISQCVAAFDNGHQHIGYAVFGFADLVNCAKMFQSQLTKDPDFVGRYPIGTYLNAALTYGFITEQEVLLGPYIKPEAPGDDPPSLQPV